MRDYYISLIPGKTDLYSGRSYSNPYAGGLVFTGWQLQTNTVLLEIEYAVTGKI